MSVRLLAATLTLGSLAGCASTAKGSATPAAPPAATRAPECEGCAKRGARCLRHVEAGPRDDQGAPLAPTEARDFPCDPSCCP